MNERSARRFWAKVEKGDGCWLWRGARTSRGYGCVCIDKVGRLAHRVSWEMANGKPVPVGMVVRHGCDTPLCVRPDHLEIGTNQENSNDCVARGRNSFGERNPRARITAADVLYIRLWYASGLRTQVDLASQFGLTPEHVHAIVRGRVWTKAGGPIASPYRKVERNTEAA